ncbi:MAG: hypothetical protein GX950_01085 [Candidatus Diapherotrites archaeon]|uniref:Uncharacterized protein n=1 Tax=Candidatus Iainarchaeum sp. TaxID=3101447 RepID=A0A7K4BZ20_9ARCH|nr:hypothetical protein [Candidatus Diapherotrites archaeon]
MLSKTKIKLSVSTGKKEFKAKWNDSDSILYVETKNAPDKGKANKEILKELTRIFKAQTQIVAGLKSRKKTISIELDSEKIKEKLTSLS